MQSVNRQTYALPLTLWMPFPYHRLAKREKLGVTNAPSALITRDSMLLGRRPSASKSVTTLPKLSQIPSPNLKGSFVYSSPSIFLIANEFHVCAPRFFAPSRFPYFRSQSLLSPPAHPKTSLETSRKSPSLAPHSAVFDLVRGDDATGLFHAFALVDEAERGCDNCWLCGALNVCLRAATSRRIKKIHGVE